jgi:hypothetical protein
MISYNPPPQTVPPTQAGIIAVQAAATSLCLAFEGNLPASQLQSGLDRGLASVGLKPVPPHQIVVVWGLATQLVQDPRVCPLLLNP